MKAEMHTSAADGAVHAMGNGHLLVYGSGADLGHVYGPTYSSDSLLSARWEHASSGLVLHSEHREPGASIWWQDLGHQGVHAAKLASAVSPDANLWACVASLDIPLHWRVRPSRDATWLIDGTDSPRGAVLVCEPTGKVFGYPYSGAEAARIDVHDQSGSVRMRLEGDELVVEVTRGVTELTISVERDVASLRDTLPADVAGLASRALERRRECDLQTTAHLRSMAKGWEHLGPLAEKAVRCIESGILGIEAQQSHDGGIMAGYLYPLAYGRDQYGACRGLGAAGRHESVARNLAFQSSKMAHFGDLANAESMGHHEVRHRHENDAVELTSYHVLQALEVAEHNPGTLTPELVAELEQCLLVQIPHLVDGMLPFNGDETYVAGGLLPRSVLNDGSLESTLLFLSAGQRLLVTAGPTLREREQIASALETVRRGWRRRYSLADGQSFYVNAPARRHLAALPDVRAGVCELCSDSPTWNRRTSTDRYVCARCWGKEAPRADDLRFRMVSASLLPFFIDSDLLDRGERGGALVDLMGELQDTGRIRSTASSERMVGYDAALLTVAAVAESWPGWEGTVEHLLSLFDSTEMMSEYYDDGAATGVRCRPWETGVAVAALMSALARMESTQRLQRDH